MWTLRMSFLLIYLQMMMNMAFLRTGFCIGKILRLLLVTSLFLMISGCATADKDGQSAKVISPAAALEDRQGKAREQLHQMLDDGQVAQVLMRIDAYRLRFGWQSEWLDDIEEQALAGLQLQYEAAIAGDNFEMAIIALRSMLADPSESSITLDQKDINGFLQLEEALFQQHLAAGRGPLAVASFMRTLDYGLPSDQMMRAGLELIEQLRDSFAWQTVLQKMAQLGQDPAVIRSNYSFPQVLPSDQVPGVVTVWVDKGVKSEGGVGQLDRMIGSGFFIDEQGHMLTNYHVIQSEVDPTYRGYSRVYIRTHESPDTRIPAQVVGYDPLLDLALLKAPVKPAYVFPVSGIKERRPGSRVYAIGSPVGLSNTITSGIISAVGRRFFQLGEAVQVDAALNPGNSGGPVVDEDGNLVGAVYAGIPQFEGLNFAVPSFWIRGVLGRLYTPGMVEHSYLGLSVFETMEGLEVIHVITGTPAAVAGVKAGDVITALGGISVTSLEQANRLLMDTRPSELLTITLKTVRDDVVDDNGKVENDGQVENIEKPGESQLIRQRIQLASRPERPLEETLANSSQFPLNMFPPLYGVIMEQVRSGWFSHEYTVERVLPGTIADDAGLSPNDPVRLRRWEYDEEQGVVGVLLHVRKRKNGYMDSAVMIPASVLVTNIL
ncbi:MAG: serine protease [Spirochaetaceae bacterium]|nr:MAG: serine protease [Spirochaetaceae bacterium]